MWIQISCGQGPDECQLAVSLFLKTYQNECKNNGIKTNIIDAVAGNISGNLKSVLLSIECQENEGLTHTIPLPSSKDPQIDAVPLTSLNSSKSFDELFERNYLNGTMLWICKSPYRPNHKRKNWFIDIETFQATEKLTFSEKDVQFESMRSSGPGGQNVNKVESAVRAFHLPTGLTVVASEERSQFMNKKLALARLTNLVINMNNTDAAIQKRTMWMQHNDLKRGNPVRIYEGMDFRLKKSQEYKSKKKKENL